MPLAESNGSKDEEALVWDTGLSQFLGRLEEDLIRWHSEERVKAKERQLKCLRAQKDLVTVEASIREAAAAQRLKGSEDDPWQDKIESLIQLAKEQRDDMRQIVDLVRGHSKSHLQEVGGSAFLQKLPDEGQHLRIGSENDLPKLTQSFLELLGQVAVGPRKGKEGRKEKRKGTEKRGRKAKAERAPRDRQVRDVEDDSYYSDWSGSRSPSLEMNRPRRRDPRGRHMRERYTPSLDSRSFSDSRSCSRSRTPSRDYHRGPRGGDRRDRRGGGGGRPGGGGAGGGGGGRVPYRRDREESKLDTPAEVDRFVRINKLDARCEKILRELELPLARRVMGLAGGSNTFELSGDIRDPTAVVLARIRKAREDPRGGRGPRSGGGGQFPPRHGPRGGDRRGDDRRSGGGAGGRDGRGRPESRSRSRSRGGQRGGGMPPRGRSGSQGRGGHGGSHQQSSNAVPLGKTREFPVKIP